VILFILEQDLDFLFLLIQNWNLRFSETRTCKNTYTTCMSEKLTKLCIKDIITTTKNTTKEFIKSTEDTEKHIYNQYS